MTVAGLRAAIELAELAMEETGFGVFEDKVVKNYVATEFLYDYLKDKRSVGVIESDPRARHRDRRGADRRRPGAAADHQPDLDGPVQVDRRRQDAQRDRLPAFRARGALRRAARSSCSRRPASAPGSRPTPSRSCPTRRSTSRSTCSTIRGVDFIWTTGGPEGGGGRQRGGQAVHLGRPRQRAGLRPPQRRREMAVTDILISKTFDASVICPAEQTCVVDEAIADELIAEFERLGARVLDDDEVAALADRTFDADGHVELAALGQSCVNLAGLAGFEAADDDKVLVAPLPADLDALARHPLAQEKLMPVLGLVRSPSVEHAIAACELSPSTAGWAIPRPSTRPTRT